MYNLKIKENITKKLSELSKKIEDMTPVFKALADLELMQTKLRFEDEKDPEGTKWENPFTIRRGVGEETGSGSRTKRSGWTKKQAWEYVKQSNFHATPPKWRFFDASKGDKILRDSGILFKSIGRKYEKDSAIVGTNISYGKKLQNGRFPFLGINEKTLENVESVTMNYFKRLGLR